MKILKTILPFVLATLAAHAADTAIPHLRQQGSVTQLIVDGAPFLVRGGEIGNSTATNPASMEPLWPKFVGLNLNTIVAPVYWDLIEPDEGRFDFSTVDQLIGQARSNKMRLVLLWFGTWKNSMSCYAPSWVKTDTKRFPRAMDMDGTPLEILSPFVAVNRDVDARAFATLMRHLRDCDGTRHTVLMVQVENEIGMIPSPRDHSTEADRAFAAAVPGELMSALVSRGDQLEPDLRTIWQRAGGKKSGSWSEVFGLGPAAEEIFMAWNFARYTDAVAAAGKKEYALPMYVNAALIRPGHQPGQYPSGGPLPHLFDVWRAAAPHLDFLPPTSTFRTSRNGRGVIIARATPCLSRRHCAAPRHR